MFWACACCHGLCPGQALGASQALAIQWGPWAEARRADPQDRSPAIAKEPIAATGSGPKPRISNPDSRDAVPKLFSAGVTELPLCRWEWQQPPKRWRGSRHRVWCLRGFVRDHVLSSRRAGIGGSLLCSKFGHSSELSRSTPNKENTK